jgi:putative restriction endonuclease
MLAWKAFGQKNGNVFLAMRSTIAKLRHRTAPLGPRDDPVIGCRILTEPSSGLGTCGYWRLISSPATL